MLTAEERSFLEQMTAKHLPGRHDQSTHGRRRAPTVTSAAADMAPTPRSADRPKPTRETAAAAGEPVAGAIPSWDDLGRPGGVPPIGQRIGHEGGSYERLPGNPRRYLVIAPDGRDISDRVPRSPGAHQTASEARQALDEYALDRRKIETDSRATWRKAMDAIPGAFHLDTEEISGFDDASPRRREAIRSALRSWKDDTFDTSAGVEPNVNAALRGRMPRTAKTDADVEALDDAFGLSRTGRKISVYRGVGDGTHILPADWQTRDLTGIEWSDRAYTATSANKAFAAEYVGGRDTRGFGLRIVLPKGSPAIALPDKLGGDDAEGEVILPRGLTFRVVKDNGFQSRHNMRWLDVEITPAAKGAAIDVETKAFLDSMAAKHLPGRHDQRSHGRSAAANRALAAAAELDQLRESIARAQSHARAGGDDSQTDLAAADERLMVRRFPGDITRPEGNRLAHEARLAAAQGQLRRDRADVLASLEQIVSINEGLGSPEDVATVQRQLATAKTRFDLPDDPRLSTLDAAVATGDRRVVLDAINDVAASLGLRRVGGDQDLGPDQVIAFDPKMHEAVGRRPRDGQLSLLVSPGYAIDVVGEPVVITRAKVEIADLHDIARAAQAEVDSRKHHPGRHDQSAHGRRRGGQGAAASGAARWLTPDAAMAMRQKMLADDPWTFEQQDALNRYVGDAYHPMNGLLRGDAEATHDLSDGEKAEFANLIRDAAQGMRPTTEPVKVKRFVAGLEAFGIDSSSLTRAEAAEALSAMTGKTVQEPGFLSTSLLESYGREEWPGRVKLELDVPAGTPAAYLDGDVGFTGEQELLLAPGTRIEITGVAIDPPRNTVKGRVVVP